MSLDQSDIQKFLEKFWIEHHNGRTFEEAAKASSVGSSTVKRFAAGAHNIGFSNLLGIVEDALEVPFLRFAVELNDWELQKNGLHNSGMVHDVSGISAYGRNGRKNSAGSQPLNPATEQESLTLEEAAEREAEVRYQSVLAQCSSKEELRQFMKLQRYNLAVEGLVLQRLAAYLK